MLIYFEFRIKNFLQIILNMRAESSLPENIAKLL